ncbi:signal recognition particle-docking protein FtsY [Companilactobacillus halodurans]|uniref:Signal recognition particle receptor FtsY n=1 Tax=Companilactobacillus halodurans TaxID=2584183 RepID=A0A5P0ZUZ8_9LACO|nr:signal recognition particle-docking protein FtsY [Companilactobacillus halodurans]MQS96857.1 signal recognition particle-docking protein FtsY [Companilactobacillus halodurans]
MGLFDRIKKAFTGKDDSKEDLEKKSQEEEATKESAESENNRSDQEKSDQKEESSDTASKKELNENNAPKESAEESTNETSDESNDEGTSKPADDNKETEPVNKSVEEASEEKTVETSEDTTKESKPESETKESVEPKSQVEEEAKPEAKAESQTQTTDESEETTKTSKQAENPDKNENQVSEFETEAKEQQDDIEEYDKGLKKSRNSFSARFNRFMANFRSVDEDFFDDLEELLIESDVGYETAIKISDELREEVKLENAKKRSDVSNVIVKKLVDMYGEEGKEEDNSLKFSTDKTPTVFLFVGVNGAGKTTTVGKLAHRYQQEGKKVLLAAADTFRAGAIEQLQEWGKRVNVPVQASKAHTDPASVVYDAVQRAQKEDFDILLVDTAGRLQNKQGLMRELEKIKRVISRELPQAPQEVLLVLDGSTGQNALSQAKQFKDTTDVTGIVLTKLDGSSQGGIVLAIRNELHLAVKLVGLGEQMDDLRDFDPEKFIYGLFKELIVGSSDK